MALQASGDLDLGFQVGDHACAFYSSSSNSLDDIVVDYLSAGLQAGHKCFGMVDTPSSVRDRIPGDLYDLDIFDGDTVMYVLRTHPQIYVNGIIITNPHYIPADQLTG
jgi:hypothetical protein